MPTLHGPFQWDGDLTNANVSGVGVRLRVEDPRYLDGGDGTGVLVRNFGDPIDAARWFQPRSHGDYAARLSAATVLGTQDDPRAFLFYLYLRVHEMGGGPGDPANLIVPVQVALTSPAGQPLASTRLDTIMFMRNLYDPSFGSTQSIPPDNVTRHTNAGLRAMIERDLFFVNQAAYETLLDRIAAIAGGPVEYQKPLYLLAFLVDLSGDAATLREDARPRLAGGPPTPGDAPRSRSADADSVEAILNNLEIGDHDAAIKLIADALPDLFGFPVSTRDVRVQDAGGIVHIRGAAPGTITAADIAQYDLSAEFTSLTPDGDEELSVIHYDWNVAPPNVQDDAAAFAFSQIAPIFPARPDESVTVVARSLDGTVLWSKTLRAGDPALLALDVALPRIGAAAVKPMPDAPEANIKRLRGQVLDLSKTANLKDVLVVVQARGAANDWHVVGSASTDPSGNFAMPYPKGVFTAARAVVSLMPNVPVAVAVDKDPGDGNTISDDFLYLLVREPKVPEKVDGVEPDCACDANVAASRLPDHADLMRSDEYMQDLGSGCLDLTTPNRTLREYSYTAIVRTSDPDVANYTLVKREGGVFELRGGGKLLNRDPVSLTNPIRWQDAPDTGDALSFYQTVSVATGHVLHYRSQFRADGYSLGDLLYSLPLAPGQKKQIVVFDSSHSLQGAESQQLSLAERLSADLLSDREVTDRLGGSLSEGLRGTSKAGTEGLSASLGAAASVGSFGASLGVAGGFSNSHSDAAQDSARDISQFFAEKLRQGLTQNAESYRQQNASVITTVTEGQKYGASTEVVANHNHCHSMTMMYFEVMRHYAIFQELAGVEECVFVPLLMTNFTMENVFKWQDVLAANLLPLPSNTYLPSADGKHPLARAFDAVTRIRTGYANLDVPPERYCDEQIGFIDGTLDLTVLLPRPRTQYDRIISLPLINKTISHQEVDVEQNAKNVLMSAFTFGLSLAGGPAMKTVYETIQVRAQLFDQFMTMEPNYASVPPAQSIRVTNFEDNIAVPVLPAFLPEGVANVTMTLGRDRFFDGNELDRRQWQAYAALMGYPDVYKFLAAYFKGKLLAEWDTIFYSDIAPVLFEKIIDNIKFSATKPGARTPVAATYDPLGGLGGAPVPTGATEAAKVVKFPGIAGDFASTARYTGGTQRMTLNLRATSAATRADIPDLLYLSCGTAVANLSDTITLRAENLTLRYRTRHFANTLFSGYLGDDLQDGTALWMPITNEDQRSPKKEDALIAAKLIEHLNSNLEHYNKALWTNLDPDRRYLLLDGFNIQVYNDCGEPVGLKSLASVVKNDLVAVAGNALVMPVASGLRVSRAYLIEQTEVGGAAKVGLLDHYKPLTPVAPYRLSVPTRGVYAEAMMGRCDSCEKVQEATSQDWTKFTTDEPTAIGQLTPPTPTVTDWKPGYQPLAAPLISMQQAPSEPAPGVGLAALTAALTNAGAFRDVTGLDKNQSNAIETYKSNNELAAKVAEAAKGLASQTHNTANSDSITKSIKEAKASGALKGDAADELTKAHIEQKIDGGAAAKRKEEAAQAAAETKAGKQSLTDAAVDAVAKGKHVTASETDHKGTTRKVQVKPAPVAVEPADEEAPQQKSWVKNIVFKALDCYGDIMQSRFIVSVWDVDCNSEAAADGEIERGTGIVKVIVRKPAPTLLIDVRAPEQENSVTPILNAIHISSDGVTMPADRSTLNVIVQQRGQKRMISTKENSLTADRVLKELSGELAVTVGGKDSVGGTTSTSGGSSNKDSGATSSATVGGSNAFEVNAAVAAKIAGRYQTEATTTAGHEDTKTYEVVLPTAWYDMTVR